MSRKSRKYSDSSELPDANGPARLESRHRRKNAVTDAGRSRTGVAPVPVDSFGRSHLTTDICQVQRRPQIRQAQRGRDLPARDPEQCCHTSRRLNLRSCRVLLDHHQSPADRMPRAWQQPNARPHHPTSELLWLDRSRRLRKEHDNRLTNRCCRPGQVSGGHALVLLVDCFFQFCLHGHKCMRTAHS